MAKRPKRKGASPRQLGIDAESLEILQEAAALADGQVSIPKIPFPPKKRKSDPEPVPKRTRYGTESNGGHGVKRTPQEFIDLCRKIAFDDALPAMTSIIRDNKAPAAAKVAACKTIFERAFGTIPNAKEISIEEKPPVDIRKIAFISTPSNRDKDDDE